MSVSVRTQSVICLALLLAALATCVHAQSTTVLPMALDRPLTGPVTVPLRQSTPVDFGVVLEKGVRYTLVVQGVGGIRKDIQQGVDALYNFRHPSLRSGTVKPVAIVRTLVPDKSLLDIARATYGNLPPFNPMHVYYVIIEGEGAPLRVMISEKDARSYTDNSGEFMLFLYPAATDVQAPGSQPGKATPPPVDADVGQ